MNCRHCHSERGPAGTSGLRIDIAIKNKMRLLPISAGQGAGGNRFSIVSGKRDASILIYQIAFIDPGAMMPKPGRGLVHDEGVTLISDWLRKMEENCNS